MPQRVVHESDLSTQLILDEAQHAEMLVRGYGDLAPRVLDCTPEEIAELGKLSIGDVVEITVKMPGEEETQRHLVTQKNFGKLAVGRSMDDVMQEARPLVETPKPNGRNGDRTDYTSLEHCGMPHKGKTSPEEAALVRDNLPAVNERRAAKGLSPIDPNDPVMAKRYGFGEHAPAEVQAQLTEVRE